ncbi:MAG: Uma2 family endonuclease [Gemmataceae bacterium]
MHTLVPAPRRPKADRVPDAITAFGRPLHPISVEQYHRMQENGAIQKQDRCELIRGFLVEKPKIKPPHASAIRLLTKELLKLFGVEAVVRFQLPITLSDSEPEPDAVLAKGIDEDYFDRHPGAEDALFVIEVSDSSLDFDRTVKLPLYAEAGIPQYWIINVADKSIEAYAHPRGGKNPGYRKPAIYMHNQSVPVIVAGKKLGTIPVAKILP